MTTKEIGSEEGEVQETAATAAFIEFTRRLPEIEEALSRGELSRTQDSLEVTPPAQTEEPQEVK